MGVTYNLPKAEVVNNAEGLAWVKMAQVLRMFGEIQVEEKLQLEVIAIHCHSSCGCTAVTCGAEIRLNTSR